MRDVGQEAWVGMILLGGFLLQPAKNPTKLHIAYLNFFRILLFVLLL